MLIIGEKINSSRKNIKEMIEKKDKDFIQNLSKLQIEGGAQMLDLNVGTFRDNEAENMRWLVNVVQEAVDVPICIDSSNPLTIKEGLEAYNCEKSKPLINSVTCEKEKLESILPLIKKYHCSVIALAMDENGIPRDAMERIRIIGKLLKEFEKQEIPLEDIYLDPLILPVSSNIQNGNISLEVLRRIKESYPLIKTIIGLSNISFGLPERKLINQAFVILAISSGLDAVILDSTDKRIMGLIRATDALLGKDNFCLKYLQDYRKGKLNFNEKKLEQYK